MVDTRDLKSLGPKGPCGFDSRPRHEQQFLGVAALLFGLILRELRLFEVIDAYLELTKMVGRFVGKTKTPTIWPLHSIWLPKPKH